MCEKKPDEPLRSAKKTTALWTVTADKDSGIPVTFDVQRPEPYCKRPIPQIFRVGKKRLRPGGNRGIPRTAFRILLRGQGTVGRGKRRLGRGNGRLNLHQ